ncbi:MAG: ABC transporter ATP-binding protein [Chlorobiaceae bacterium]|nr:ABC transporter ATP-binding protein [Chlorobiaceae bacterium]
MSGISLVSAYIKQNKASYFLGMGLVATGSFFAAQIPRLLGRVTDSLRNGSPGLAEMAGYAGLIVLIGGVRVVAGWSGRVLVHHKGRVLTYRLRKELFEKWGTLSPSYYHRNNVGDMISHALSDVEVVRELVSQGFNQGISATALFLGALLLMVLNVDWRLTLAGMGPLLVIPLLVKWLGPAIRLQSQRAQEAIGDMAQTTEEVVEGIRAIKAFGTEKVFIDRFEKRVDAIAEEKMRFAHLSALFTALVPLMVNLGFILVLGYGGILVTSRVISLGDFVAFTLYVVLLRLPLEQLGNVVNIVQRAVPSLNRIDELFHIVPDILDKKDVLDRPIQGAIEVRGLTFRYPGSDRSVLEDISFSVKPGQTLGIIGSVGSGKSSLADLLLRLYDPPSGTVFFDGQDILTYPLRRLREGIAYVPQDGFLFSSTVLENIGFSDEFPDRERAESCARVAAVHDNIGRFSEGYDTEIGERGIRLSGGQKQRLAIARMIYKDAPIQIMDDSLSAVDAATEWRILENLDRLSTSETGKQEGKVTIIISHRLSAVRHADEILVFEEGRIVERGTHASLLSIDGIYAAQWFIQTGQFGNSETDGAVVKDKRGLQEPVLDVERDSLEAGHLEDVS